MSASMRSVANALPPHCRALTPAPLLTESRFVDFIATVDGVLERFEASEAGIAGAVAEAVSALIAQPDWLPPSCLEGCDESYKRHLLYADPEGRYTVMALVWQHGQGSAVHGHTAWCAMGVYSGNPSAASYTCEDGVTPVQTGVHHCSPGQVVGIEPGKQCPHRVYNDSQAPVVTIHAYGRDLVDDPCCINILFD